ncbi:MAG: ATP-dependent DNA helicase RecG [Treponema sp.]|jgi:ATP-dependent DNA helicase RecG|nr:ATP-dependent DNA helicase RecG [Treponema sp.]
MFLRELAGPVNGIRGAGPAAVRALAGAGVSSVAALLCYYPRDWEDRSRPAPIRDFIRAPVNSIVRVIAHDWIGFGRMKTLKVHIEDESGRAVLVCFNRPFLEKQLVTGNRYRLWGRFFYKYGEIQSSSFEFEALDSGGVEPGGPPSGAGAHFGRILPVYPLSGGLKQVWLRRLTATALRQYTQNLDDELPPEIIEREALFPKSQAIRAIHFPASMEERDRARKTLIWEELFYLEIMVGRRALERKKSAPGNRLAGGVAAGFGAQGAPDEAGEILSLSSAQVTRRPPHDGNNTHLGGSGKAAGFGAQGGRTTMQTPPEPGSEIAPPPRFSLLQSRLLERLPFDLTPGQMEAVAEINRDMDGPYPMARLLQGDVGSGKTLVSFLAALRVVDGPAENDLMNGGALGTRRGQAALMAPTELLARQHAENAARLLEPLGIRPCFLTGNIRAAGRKALLKSLAAGDIDIVIGTHALFSQDVIYRDLRLVVVDEQHRFGVTQRALIMAKGDRPDLLMMSATPIPRTLALTIFGDLDVSVIRDMPPGRKPVKTHLARESNEGKVYDFVRKELAAGHQAYFVYPLIGDVDEDENENDGEDEGKGGSGGGRKDAVSMSERLAREVFPQYSAALIHSRVEETEKQRIMEAFRRGEIRILAATSVVEVGVDVPNATCMVVEHAERFGLSALHQLRGRVGRGQDQAYCFLIYSDKLTEDGKTRLKVMLEHADGFVIAEEDLKLRGPGQIAGVEQSGYLSLGIADPVRDVAELARARDDAFAILEQDPGLLLPEHCRIAGVLEKAPPFDSWRGV